MTKVYLAGPINGCTDDEAVNWRELAKLALGEENCIDPMRRDYRGIEDQHVAEIITGDKFDIRNSDVVIANCWQPSWGTAMEIHYAHEIGVPVIVVLPADARVSPWLTYHAEMIVHDIKQAVDKIGS